MAPHLERVVLEVPIKGRGLHETQTKPKVEKNIRFAYILSSAASNSAVLEKGCVNFYFKVPKNKNKSKCIDL